MSAGSFLVWIAFLLAPQGAPPKPPAWDLKLGFSYLATTGNADTSSAGFDARYVQEWSGWGLEATAAAVRATRNERETAEHYNSQVRGRRKLGDGTELTLGLQGERNRFAGIDARTLLDTSLLQPLFQSPEWKVQSLTGISWTREDPLGGRPESDNLGGLVQLQAAGKLSPTAELAGQTTWFPDLEEPDDYRFQGQVSVQAALNKHLGVRVGYDLKYDNEPVQGFNRMDTSTTASLVLQLNRK
ncbi:MAG: putative salt-induced outer membrane protein [Acidobacteriota bacterium]|jgi:putative salt-induced outer membrane protein YdiY|nr:putative salt-induced outer membrane protein [Acidobacteriota bacterium]